MSVAKGYMQTKVGEIPVDWEIMTLGSITDKILGGGTPSRSNATFWGNEIPWVTVKDFATFSPLKTQEYITTLGLKNSSSNLITKGVLITSTRMALGKAVVYEIDVAINQDLKALYFIKKISTDYLYYWFQNNARKIEELGSGSTVMGISLVDLKQIMLPIPTLSEQTAIAKALSDMDALISQTEKLIEKKKAIKQGAMQELLKPKEGWVTKKLGDVCEVFGRIGFRGYTVEDIVPEHQGAISLSPSNIIDGKLSLNKVTYISWDKYYESPEIMVNEGDIILVKTASIGKNCVITKLDSKATINPQIVVLKNFKMDNLLLGYIISSPIVQNQIKTKMVGGVLATLSQEEIKNFRIEVPERHENQKRISNLLFDLDETINLMGKKLSKLKQQKQGMMQALLTGKIRLVS